VCLDTDCLNSNILCFDCYCKQHKQHKRVNLLKFLTELLAFNKCEIEKVKHKMETLTQIINT